MGVVYKAEHTTLGRHVALKFLVGEHLYGAPGEGRGREGREGPPLPVDHQALDQLRRTLDMDPNYWMAHVALGLAYERKGDVSHAVAEFRKAGTIEGSFPWYLAELGYADAVSGRKNEAEQAIKELYDLSKKGYVPAYYTAVVYAGLGEKQKAIAWLEKGYADHSWFVTPITVDPELDSLRSEPRFQDLVRRMGLQP